MPSIADLKTYAASLEQQFGLPPGFLSGQAQAESSWNPNAQNGNASGLMQFMPETAKEYNVNTADPISSLYGAAQYDSNLYAQTGSWQDVLTRYGTTANNATATNPAAASVNKIAGAADLLNNMFGPGGMNLVTEMNPDGTPKNGNMGSGTWLGQLQMWVAKEKYNGISIIVGVAFVIAGGISMMGGSKVNVLENLT